MQNSSIQCSSGRAMISFVRVELTNASGQKKSFKINRSFLAVDRTREELVARARICCSGRAAQKKLVDFLKA